MGFDAPPGPIRRHGSLLGGEPLPTLLRGADGRAWETLGAAELVTRECRNGAPPSSWQGNAGTGVLAGSSVGGEEMNNKIKRKRKK